MLESDDITRMLTQGAWGLIDAALQYQQDSNSDQLGLHHWLLALVKRHGKMAEEIAQGLEAPNLQRNLPKYLGQGDIGLPLDIGTVVHLAVERAQARGKEQAAERDLGSVILQTAGYQLDGPYGISPQPIHLDPFSQSTHDAFLFEPRALNPTPVLSQFGRDLTLEAQQGKLSPVIGRDNEVQLVIETLCRRTKRNPLLVGPAGVGKTALVEGLAQSIIANNVPDILRGVRVLGVQMSTLVSGASVAGEFEKRVEGLINEASQDGIILFIDEVHSIVGAGGRPGTSDAASLLKPPLARGDIACIGATTDEEYRQFIEPDAALERRFQPIRVQELTVSQTLDVLIALRDELSRIRGVYVDEKVLHWMVDFAHRFLRNRYFPDKAVDVLEQCVAYAVTQGKPYVEHTDAESVAQRMIGMPLAITSRLQALQERLSEQSLLLPSDANTLLNRLEVTVRGLDLRSVRPNGIVLLTGNATSIEESLARTIAEALFGAAERMVTIDFSQFVHPHDITMLIGAPPGYVGYTDQLPLHRVLQMPWCVLRCQNIHACHPKVREVFTQALASGMISDTGGKTIYLSDTIILITADVTIENHRSIGFQQLDTEEETPIPEIRRAVEQGLGAMLAEQIDLVCTDIPTTHSDRQVWLQQHLLLDLAERYQQQGIHVSWDQSVLDWLIQQQFASGNQREWERLIDEQLSPVLVRYLPKPGTKATVTLKVMYQNDAIHIEQSPLEEERR